MCIAAVYCIEQSGGGSVYCRAGCCAGAAARRLPSLQPRTPGETETLEPPAYTKNMHTWKVFICQHKLQNKGSAGKMLFFAKVYPKWPKIEAEVESGWRPMGLRQCRRAGQWGEAGVSRDLPAISWRQLLRAALLFSPVTTSSQHTQCPTQRSRTTWPRPPAPRTSRQRRDRQR